MPVSEELQAEVDAAIEDVVAVEENADEGGGEENPGGEENGSKVDDESGAADGDGNSEAGGKAGEEQKEEGRDSGGDESTGEDGGGEEKGAANKADQVVLSDEAVSAAVEAGVPVSVALRFESDAALVSAVDSIKRANTWVMSEEEAGKDAADPLADLPVLDPEEHSKEAIELFGRLTSVIKEQRESLNEFRESQQQVVQAGQVTAAREIEGWFDKQVNDLGEDYAEALGTGGYGDQAQGSSQRAKRDNVASHMAVMLAGYQAQGMDAPPREQVFESAVQAVLGDDIAKIGEAKLSGKLAKRGKQHMQRASGKSNKSNKSPEEDVAALLDAKFFAKS